MSKPGKIAVATIATLLLVLLAGGGYAAVRYKTYYVRSDSMAPTLTTNQIFVTDRFAYRDAAPRRGDVVTFMPPVQSDAPFFKRVMAIPGDRFAIHGARTYVNGKRIPEPYAPHAANYDLAVRDYSIWVDGARLDAAYAFIPPRAQWTASDTVPRGCYVVLGDNRTNSEDSHSFGFLCPEYALPNQPHVQPELLGRALVPPG